MLIGGSVSLLVMALLAISLVWWMTHGTGDDRGPPGAAPDPRKAPVATSAETAADQGAVLRFLRKDLGDPDYLEVIEVQPRSVPGSDLVTALPAPGSYYVRVRYSAKTAQGEGEHDDLFRFERNQVQWRQPWNAADARWGKQSWYPLDQAERARADLLRRPPARPRPGTP
jgi:hypothetical protein